MLLTTAAAVTGGVAYKAISLIGVGCALSLGFWVGKRMTNRIDVYLYTHSKDYRKELALHKE